MTQTNYRPRRSCLYMPASNSRALEKAKSLAADTIIFDLEDAVAPDAKDDAREQACAALQSGAYGNRELVVRINATDTPWFAQDLKKACRSGADAVLVPKILSAEDIVTISDLMDEYDAARNSKLWAMIEMPLAILNLPQIAALGTQKRLTGFVMGFNDLAKEMHADHDRANFASVMTQTVIAARAYGIEVIDSVYNDFNDPDGLEAECLEARRLGFDGKSLIHPVQIETANRIFAPQAEALAEAEAIIAAFRDPVNAGKGVIVVDGKMTELLHLKQARQLVATAAAIEALAK
ncbi:HpcH/HpaI aldolase/citrate lyase family protein [Sphingorhabdus sp. 109]|jgi:citrate lyase subunit beta/citryl-CoA lyase|uniref:HpcH/HpaI aldolase/citrate lyase family protein n=1 Tax=Sphingorhabdus sp. 109 TaxID=2653173 RepID=UPI0012F1886A|nr:CoA ester lyase [Sphingorhabdus sp. 109]VWX58454.1 (3S)-malyl-CoA thioesterase [Sphingorhabdus sp. 109]